MIHIYIYVYIYVYIYILIYDIDTINIRQVIVIISYYCYLLTILTHSYHSYSPLTPLAACRRLWSSQQLLLALQFHGLRGSEKKTATALYFPGKVGSSQKIPKPKHTCRYVYIYYIYMYIYIYMCICIHIIWVIHYNVKYDIVKYSII